MGKTGSEAAAEEGVRLILRGLKLDPGLIEDLRKRAETERLAAERSRRRVLTTMGSAAALAVGIGGMWFWGRWESPVQPTLSASRTPQATVPPAVHPSAPPDRAQAEVRTQAHEEDRPNSVGIEWVRIPGGSFMMGTIDLNYLFASAKPVHEVNIHPFKMSKTEVTNRQYRACVNAGTCTAPQDQGLAFDGDDQPAVGVDWNQARAFAKWVGGRLPSEAEWEYAAKSAGKDWEYPWGNGAPCAHAVISGCGQNNQAPARVCSMPSGNTEQGLCDMAGNAWEWVEDWIHNSYNGAPTDGSAWVDPASSFRVFRGGSWSDVASYARSAIRSDNYPDYRSINLGFRVAR